MKFKIIVLLLVISLLTNLFIFGKYLLVDQWYTPSDDEEVILSEMVQKTIESDDYKSIAAKENVISIDTSLDRNKGGVYPYYFEVSVSTDQQTYLFNCKDAVCSEVVVGGTMYSIYQDEKPRLPLNK